MTGPPPDDLMRWSKTELAREIQRLRAITREHSERTHGEARAEGEPTITDPIGDQYARGNVILDARGAVLLDSGRAERGFGSEVEASPSRLTGIQSRVSATGANARARA